jgi:hypothetical protein
MAHTNFTCKLHDDTELRLTEEISGHVFRFRLINGELDDTSDLVEPSSDPDAKPADYYREDALLAARRCLDKRPPEPTGWPLSHPEPSDG